MSLLIRVRLCFAMVLPPKSATDCECEPPHISEVWRGRLSCLACQAAFIPTYGRLLPPGHGDTVFFINVSKIFPETRLLLC